MITLEEVLIVLGYKQIMHTFTVYPDGCGNKQEIVPARTAREAAESYWEERIIEGDERVNLNTPERIIVEHPNGPQIDKSVTWITDEDGTFARFDVSVRRVEVMAVKVKDEADELTEEMKKQSATETVNEVKE